MFANNNMLFVMLNAKSDALGDVTATTTSTKTFAGAGNAGSHTVGLAVATAFAEGTTAAAPYTDATTNWLGSGGDLTSSHSGNVSFHSPYGPTPVSLSISSTAVTTWGLGDVWSAKSFRLRTLTIRSQVCAHLDPAVRVGGLSDPWPGKCPSFRHEIARSTLRMPTGV